MTPTYRHNPVHFVLVVVAMVTLVAMYQDPTIRPFLPHLPSPAGASANWTSLSLDNDVIRTLAFDETNGVIYAPTYASSGRVHRCATSSGCDAAEDWSSYVLPETLLISSAIDEDNHILYIGTSASNGSILRCDLGATGCDSADDWTTAFTTTDDHVQALVVANGFVYAGVQAFTNDSTFYRCDIAASGGCDDAGDWTVVRSFAAGRVKSFFYDDIHSVIYVAYQDNSFGSVMRCDFTSGCDEDGDWTIALSPSRPVVSFTMDRTNGILYAGTLRSVTEEEDNPALMARCDLTTNCDADADWTTFGSGGFEELYTLFWESGEGMIYANGPTWCNTATGCDEIGDWTTEVSPDSGRIIIEDTTHEILYAGDEGGGLSRCDVASGCNVTVVPDGLHDASDVLGQADFTSGDPGSGTNGFTSPTGVSVDRIHDRLFVADYANNRVLVFGLNADGTLTDKDADYVLGQSTFDSTTASTSETGMWGPNSVAYDAVNDRLFVADYTNSRVLGFNLSGGISSGMAADIVLGQGSFTTADCATSITGLCHPQDVSIEPLNQILVVADSSNSRVIIYDGVLSNGMPASRVLGQPDFDSTNVGVTAGALNGPAGVLAETNTDTLWVSDFYNNRVLGFDLFGPSSGSAYVVLGQSSFTSNSSGNSSTQMQRPLKPALIEVDDETQRLFVPDFSNNRVLVFNTGDGIDNGEAAVDVYGQPGFDTGSSATTRSRFYQPQAVEYDESSATLWITDGSNQRLLSFVSSTSTPSSTPAGGASHGEDPVLALFSPDHIAVNENRPSSDGHNVFVQIHAVQSPAFTGFVTVLLSNTPDFASFIPFTFRSPTYYSWPKEVSWDLCFGLSEEACHPGDKTVYARFYVNVPAPAPALTPLPIQ